MTPRSRVLITGGAGFVGRALVARCREHGHDVTVIDNFATGRRENLSAFTDGVRVHEADILDEHAVNEIVSRTKPDIVFHLAALHFIPFCNAHPLETIRTNVDGSYGVLTAAAAHGVRCAVVASTGALYPSVDEPLREDLEPAPVDVYGLTKLLMEHVTHHIHRTTGMACVIARLFNVYGPYETNPHLIPEIISGLRRGPALALGNTDTYRDYVYVDDVADMLLRCAHAHDRGCVTVNIGTGVEYTARDIVEALSKVIQTPIRIEVDPARVRAVDKRHQRADVRRLEQLVGAHPGIALAEGLRRLAVHEGLCKP